MGIRGYPTRKNRVPKPENHLNVYPKPDPIYFWVLQYPPRVSIPDVSGTQIPDSLHVLITNKKIQILYININIEIFKLTNIFNVAFIL